MKKIYIIFLSIIILLFSPNAVKANMAAPLLDDIATSISFEKSRDIDVTSETLDINILNTLADIKVTYNLKNIKNEDINTASMFVSPNIEGEAISIKIADKEVDCIKETYYYNSYDDLTTNDWEYIILEKDYYDEYYNKVQTLTFNINFNPLEEKEIIINYKYRLGGRPNRIDDMKWGSLTYYLKPAALWHDFSNLTINLYLSKDMPVLKESNLEFSYLGNRHYQYKSNILPEENLEIEIGLNNWQKFIGHFRNPYLIFELMFFIPFIVIGLLILVIIIIFIRRKNKRKKQLTIKKNSV